MQVAGDSKLGKTHFLAIDYHPRACALGGMPERALNKVKPEKENHPDGPRDEDANFPLRMTAPSEKAPWARRKFV